MDDIPIGKCVQNPNKAKGVVARNNGNGTVLMISASDYRVSAPAIRQLTPIQDSQLTPLLQRQVWEIRTTLLGLQAEMPDA